MRKNSSNFLFFFLAMLSSGLVAGLLAVDVYKLPGLPGGGGRLIATNRGLLILPRTGITIADRIEITYLDKSGNPDSGFKGEKSKAVQEGEKQREQ